VTGRLAFSLHPLQSLPTVHVRMMADCRIATVVCSRKRCLLACRCTRHVYNPWL